MDWSRYADGFAAAFVPAAFVTPPLGRLYNGILTLTLPDGGHRTFRIKTQYPGSPMAGKRWIGILVGPVNTDDYQWWGVVDTDGIHPFKKVLGSQDEAGAFRRYADVLWRLAGGEKIDGYDVLESRHCLRCNRVLTDNFSIMDGRGPTCRGKS